jgi:simple sugar transport system permease protein
MNWSTVSAQFMIIAVGACMLMIAGEFDLSVGSMIGFAGMSIAILGVTLGWPIWIAILLTFALCIAIGALNGLIVVRTGLPSFIVTLAFLFILRGFTIFFPQIIERRRSSAASTTLPKATGWRRSFGGKVFGFVFQWLADIGLIDVFERGNRAGEPVIDGIPMLIVWALFLVAVGAFRADAHAVRQLDFRLRRGRAGGTLCRRAGGPGEDPDVHVHGLLRLRLRHLPGDGVRIGRGRPRPAEGVRGDHRGGHRRRASDRGLRLGRGRGAWGADLRGGAAGAVLRGRGKSSLFRVFLGVILLFAVILNTYIRRIITGER